MIISPEERRRSLIVSASLAGTIVAGILVIIVMLIADRRKPESSTTEDAAHNFPLSPQQKPVFNSPNKPTGTAQKTKRQLKLPDFIDGPEGGVIISQMPIECMDRFLVEVDISYYAAELLQPAVKIQREAEDSRKMKKSFMGTTTNKEEVVSVDQMLSADFVSLVKSAMSNSQSDPFNMPIGALIKVLRKNSHDAMQLLQDENSEVLEFYWECTRTGWVYKYLCGHCSQLFSGFTEVRELMLYALTKKPSAEHKFAIETAIAKLPNPYQPLISHLQKNPQVQHVKDLSFYLVELLGVAASVDAIQSPPDLKQRVNTLYEEVKLRARILIFLNSEAAEVTAEVEKDAKQSVDMAVHLDLTDQQVKSLKSLLSN